MQRRFWTLSLATMLAVMIGSDSGLGADAADQSDSADWPLWSGPQYNLATTAGGSFDRPNLGLELLWQRPFGPAYSAISVVGKRLVTTYSDGESDLLVALDAATGEELWRFRLGDTYRGHDGSQDGPVATPTIHDGMVYGLGPRGLLVALRLDDGSAVWTRQLVEELHAKEPLWGFNSSPTIVDGVLVLGTGGPDGHAVTALDPGTGEQRWSVGDDPVYYQSPTVWTLDGEEQVVALTNTLIMGLQPATGTVLWSAEHRVNEGAFLGYQQPVPLSDGRVLLTAWTESRMLQVGKDDGGAYSVTEQWQSRKLTLRGSMAVPAVKGEHLFGFSGPFLACVDAGTGEALWRSRPPGQGNLVVVDDSLVILTDGGEVVIADAAADGYHERARIKALEEGSVMRPTVAAGKIFVRSHAQIACIGPRQAEPVEAAPAAAEEPLDALLGEMAAFASKVAGSEDKEMAVAELLAGHEQYPILEGKDLAHFVFRGEVAELAVTGSWMPYGRQRRMHHIAGTDLYLYSTRIRPGGSYLYSFTEYDEHRPDPLNPRRPGWEGADYLSLFTTPGWQEPAGYQEPQGARGRLDTLTWESPSLGNQREVQVYLPGGYDSDEDTRYPLLMVLSMGSLEIGKLDLLLDNLVSSSVAPLIVAFVGQVSYADWGSEAEQLSAALGTELLPLLDRRYRTTARPEDRAIMGSYNRGTVAMYTALHHPELFSRVAVRSFVFGDLEERISGLLTPSTKELAACVVWSTYDIRDGDPEGTDAAADSRRLVELLEAQGAKPVTIEVASGVSGWGAASFPMIWHSWRESSGRMLEALFPRRP